MISEARFDVMPDGKYKAVCNGASAVFDTPEAAALWLEKRMYPDYYTEKEE